MLTSISLADFQITFSGYKNNLSIYYLNKYLQSTYNISGPILGTSFTRRIFPIILTRLCKHFNIIIFMISRPQNLFSHSLFVKHLDHFQYLPIVNYAAMTFLAIVSCLYLWLILQNRYLGVELLDQRVWTLWSFLINILAEFLMHITAFDFLKSSSKGESPTPI